MKTLILILAAAVHFASGVDLSKAVVSYDPSDARVVGIAANLLADDVNLVSGRRPEVREGLPKSAGTLILAGTPDGNAAIRQLIRSGRIDVSTIEGTWERWAVRTLTNPFPGIRKAVVIVGSDRRAAAYGLLDISEKIGVSPWYWWADVPVKKGKAVFQAVEFDSPAPSVKYRGIFINDEDWGLLPWATDTFEPEEGSIGPKTYAKVCELLLRLKANYLCPAMHKRSKAFNENPANKEVADRYGIVMGSVHCEPLLYNNAREWDKTTQGAWNYETNKETINGVLRKRVSENGKYENVWTLALRGLHDKAMEGTSDMEERKRILENALEDQRQILREELGVAVETLPQAFTPYKEVLDLYERGMHLPDEVTIIWPDDNYGYMKRLCNPDEQKRAGRAGVYYHVSYHGRPHDFLWLDTTPPALMYEELSKAYRTGSDRIWLLNVGDLKFCEYSTDLFLRMAYDIDRFSCSNVTLDKAQWLSAMFGEQNMEKLGHICDEFFNLAFVTKPEYMGWGQEWNRKYAKQASVTDTDFSFSSYREAQTRLERYAGLEKQSLEVLESLPDEAKAAYFELVHYHVVGASQMNRMCLLAQRSRGMRDAGLASAALEAGRALESYDELKKATDGYNSLLGGKWKGIASLKHGATAHYFERPKVDASAAEGPAGLAIICDGDRAGSGYPVLPCFNKFIPSRTYRFSVCNTGEGSLGWKAVPSESWIRLDKSGGSAAPEEEVTVSIDWAAVPAGKRVQGRIRVSAEGGAEEDVLVSVFNPASPSREALSGLFVEDDGVVSIPAALFHRKVEKNGILLTRVPGLSADGDAVMMGDALQEAQSLKDTVSRLEYDFYTFEGGRVDVYTWALPTFPLYKGHMAGEDYAGSTPTDGEQMYGVSIDGAEVMCPTVSSSEYAQAWMDNVLRNSCVKKTGLYVEGSGKHTLRLWAGTCGVILQKVVLDFGGMRKSLQGPPATIGE